MNTTTETKTREFTPGQLDRLRLLTRRAIETAQAEVEAFRSAPSTWADEVLQDQLLEEARFRRDELLELRRAIQ